MWKSLSAAAAAILVAGSTFVFAQQGPSDPGQHRRFRISSEDAQAFADARIAALKAGLRLTPEQEKSWPLIEAAIRELAKQRIDRMAQRRDRMEKRDEQRAERRDAAPRPDALDLLRRRADALSTRGASLKKLADAAEPLYKSLDEGQKRRLHVLARGLRARAEAGDRPHWRGHFREHFRRERPDRL